MERRTKVVYKITYPNGKICVGMDLTGTLLYFGSASSPLVEADFTSEQRRDFTVRKEVLRESVTATDAEVRRHEMDLIRALQSNDPAVGYNRTHDCVDWCQRQSKSVPAGKQAGSLQAGLRLTGQGPGEHVQTRLPVQRHPEHRSGLQVGDRSLSVARCCEARTSVLKLSATPLGG